MQIEQREYYQAEEPQIIGEIGKGVPLITFNVGTHGNEVQPIYAVEEILQTLSDKDILGGSVRFTLANPPALRERKRYLEYDLNRAYPGSIADSGEKKLAAQLLPLVSDADYVVDLHTAPQSPPVVILGKRNEQRLELAEASGVEPIVLFEGKVPVAMVDFVRCGIGIELGKHQDPQSKNVGVQVIQNYLRTLGMLSGNPIKASHKYFEVVGSVPFEAVQNLPLETIQDFQKIDPLIMEGPDGEDIYPFLTGTHSYSSIFCFLVRQVERDYLTHY